MTLHDNLCDTALKKAFLTTTLSVSEMPTLTSANAAVLVKHFRVSPNIEMTKAKATTAYLVCGVYDAS